MSEKFGYQSALEFIHGATGMSKKLGLSNMRALLARLGDPQNDFPAVHVAGTNGKGSVCAFVHAGLVLSGKKTGLYTSPFLQRYNERIRIDGEPIPDDKLACVTEQVKREVEALRAQDVWPTEFEIGTAIAFLYFSMQRVDAAVIEVGLGGRFDPTNVLVPKVCAIASIGLDHTGILGDTMEKIAFEKAGIAKAGVPLVLSAQVTGGARETIAAQCARVGAPLVEAREESLTPLGLPGAHQRYNAGAARAVLETLGVSEAVVYAALRRARWPARLEWLRGCPSVLLDGAHNPQGAKALCGYVKTLPRQKTVLLCGILRDKDYAGVVDALRLMADEVIAVSPDSPRALSAQELAEAFSALGAAATSADSVREGIGMARAAAGPEGRVVIAGSLYLAGEARTLLAGRDDALLQSSG